MEGCVMADYFLDITDKMCPMTFVKTKLLLERMAHGETAEVRLRAGEPLENVPRSLREMGQEIIGTQQENDGIWRLIVRKITI
jgi:TusA-related sulfurtransferase